MLNDENLRPNDGNCVFCGEPYATYGWAYGNNPEPLFDYHEARACDLCNGIHVIPARLAQLGINIDS